MVLQGVPSAATIDDLPNEVTDDAIALKWSEPQNNGKVITQYTVYQRIVTDGKPQDWIKLKTITDVSVRELKVELEEGKVYEFMVTATNELGESFKEDGKIRRVKTPNGMFYVKLKPLLVNPAFPPKTSNGSDCPCRMYWHRDLDGCLVI